MYRSKKAHRKTASAHEAVLNDSGEPVNQTLTHRATVESQFAERIMSHKVRLMAPFMFYDKALRQVVSNPAHDRVLRAEVSRVQGVVLRELRKVLESESSSTPKEMLYGIQRTVLFAYASCALQNDIEALVPISSDEEAVVLIPRLESLFAGRTACAKAIASVAALLSTGIVKDTYVEACRRLEARIEAEEHSNVHKKRTKDAYDALICTKKNATDLFQLRGAMETAFDSMSSSFIDYSKPSLTKSVAGDMTTAILTVESYYSLLGWVLMVQPERWNLEAARSALSVGNVRPGVSEVYAKVIAYDPEAGKITIERPTLTSKWGLMLNPDGALVGIENALRNATPEGEFLYRALQQESAGLVVFDINRRRIRPRRGANENDSVESEANRQGKLLEALQGPDLVINLSVSKVDSILTQPQEVGFEIIPQGGENASGQQVALIIKRPSTDVPWHLRISRTDETLILEDVAEEVRLSGEAKEFLSEHHGRLLIVNVNGCDTSAVPPKFLSDVIRSSMYLVMRLQVMDEAEHTTEVAQANAPAAMEVGTTAATMEVGVTETQAELDEETMDAEMEAAQAIPTRDAKVAVVSTSEEAVDDDDAEVTRHRALLEANNISPDEPLPEIDEPRSQTKKKHARSEIHTVEAVEAVNETTLPESDELVPEEASLEMTEVIKKGRRKTAASLEVEEMINAKEKARGRPKKIAAHAEEEAPPFEEIPTPETLDDSPPEETSGEELREKKRGRPKKIAAHAEEEAPPFEEIPTPETLDDSPPEETSGEELREKKRGRPKKIAAHAEEEAPPFEEIPTPETLDDSPPEDTSGEELREKKRGRPKKIAAHAEEEAPPFEEIPTPETLDDSPPEETSGEELREKKRGRPKKIAVHAEEEAPPFEEIPTPETLDDSPPEETSGEELREKKRGRPKKIAAYAEEEAPSYEEVAAPAPGEGVLNEEAGKKAHHAKEATLIEVPAAEAENEEAPKKRGRSKKPSLDDAAQEMDAIDVPLVKIKSRFEVAEEVSKKLKKTKKQDSKAAHIEEGINEAGTDVAAALDATPPLTFENAVTLDRFDGATLELRRPDVKTPWDIKISLSGDEMIFTRLPPVSAALRTHPFLKRLSADTDGTIKWYVDAVNGTDLTGGNRAARNKALDIIKKVNKVSFMLRRFR